MCKSKKIQKIAIHRLHRLQLADEAVQLDVVKVDDEAAGWEGDVVSQGLGQKFF